MNPLAIPLPADASVVHALPSYDDVNVPYSLRLPAYRSSYMRRYHPYPRYYTPTKQHDIDTDVDELLDLSPLHLPSIIHPVAPNAVQDAVADNFQGPENALRGIQGRNEEPVVANPGVVYANLEPQEEEGNQAPFLRLDVADAL